MAAPRSLASLAFLLAALLVGCSLDFEGDDDIGDPPLDDYDAPCRPIVVDAPWFDAVFPVPDARPAPDARSTDQVVSDSPDAWPPCNEGYPDARWPDAPPWPDAATGAR